MKTELIILGAGGHAKVVIATARSCGIEPAAVYDDDESKLGSEFCGLKIMGKIVDISESQTGSAFIAIGSNAIRKTISQKFKNFTWPTLRHPTAFICETAKIGNGSIICAGAVIQPDVVIGDHAIINTGSNIDHDCEIGDYTHICPGCNIAGSVNVSEGAMLGTGVSVIPGKQIAAWATIGAGAAVTINIPANSTAVGVPARILSRPKHNQNNSPENL